LPLHRIDPGDIACNEVIAATHVGDHLKLAACKSCGGTRAAEMDERRKILLLLRRCRHIAGAGENISDIAVQIHGRELDGMARDHAGIEAGIPAAGIGDRVVPDAESCSLGVGAVQHLVEADRAGGGLVNRERIEAQSPAPVGARHRIAAALDLRQRGQQLWCDCAGGVASKERGVLPPRLGRLLVERVADKEEQLGRLPDHLIDEVRERCDRKQDRHAGRDPHGARRSREPPSRPPRAPQPAAKAREEAMAVSWHAAWSGVGRIVKVIASMFLGGRLHYD